MAKKQTKKVEVEEPYVEETVVVETPKPEPKPQPVVEKKPPSKDVWDLKNRVYYLKGNNSIIPYRGILDEPEYNISMIIELIINKLKYLFYKIRF